MAATGRSIWLVSALGLIFAGAMFAILLLLLRRGDDGGLPPIKLGIDKCHHCNMIISDLRYAAAIRESADGRSEVYTFDDLGCLLFHLRGDSSSNRQAGARQGYVHDYESSEPVEMHHARFEKGDYHTPMGSGWIARSKSSTGVSYAEFSETPAAKPQP